jgi:hypothetical protein|tara:strand:+ start:620 stop:877 length:258 start_codon:yes stop_codon:yes gene_type:complete
MSTKVPIYESPEIEIYTDCFNEELLFVKLKKPNNFIVEGNNFNGQSSLFERLEITAETNIEVFRETAINFLKWYDNEYIYPGQKS